PLIQVMSRDQRVALTLAVDVTNGSTTTLREQRDEVWVDLVPGVPACTPKGGVLSCEDSGLGGTDGPTKRLFLDGEPLSPAGLHVRSVLSVDDDGVLVTASTEPTEVHLARVGYAGTVTESTAGPAVHGG